MKKCFLFLFLIGSFSYSQNSYLSGKVTDTLSNTLAYANILAKPATKNIDISFAISDESGLYKLKLNNGELYNISVSYLGYKTNEFQITATKNSTKNIKLQYNSNVLDEVLLIHKIPIIVKRDTIVYDSKVFTNGKERKLNEVLRKLPGVEVDNKGNVSVLGKKVNKLLVDGKVFFGGGTKLGVENIPAEVIDGVEVLDNYSEVAFLKGIEDSNKMVMNIKLKKEKKHFSFGDIGIGGGNNKHYLIHPNLFHYSPKTNINFIGDFNDVGVKSFTLKQYMDFEGGIGKLFTDPNSYFKLSNSNFSQFLENDDFVNSENKFGAFNLTKTITNFFDASVYTIVSNNKTNTQNEETIQYLANAFEAMENRVRESYIDNFFLMSKITLNYKPTNTDDISQNIFVKTNNNYKSSEINSSFINLNTNLNSDALTIKHNAEWHKKISKQHTASLALNYHYDKSSPETNWLTTDSILPNLIPLQDDVSFNIIQNQELKLQNLDLLVKHYWVLNNENHIYTSINNNLLNQRYNTNDFQLLSNGLINNFNVEGFGNNLDFKLNDFSFGIQHKFKTGIAVVKYGVSAHKYHLKINQNTEIKKSKTVWLPDFSFKIDFSKSEHLNLKYNLVSTFNDAPKYANKFQLGGYNNVKSGNENLENELIHSARLWYTKFSLLKGLALNGSVTYYKKIKSIRNNVQIEGINQFTIPVLTDNPENTWIFNTSIRKKLGKFTIKAKGNLRYYDYIQLVNEISSNYNSKIKNFGLEVSTNLNKSFSIEIGFDKRFNNYYTDSSTSNFSNEQPSINLGYSFFKNFTLSADYSKNIYNENNQKNIYEIANASVFYKKENSAWSFVLKGTNIFDVSFKNSNFYSDFIISDEKTFILPRIWLFTIYYKI